MRCKRDGSGFEPGQGRFPDRGLGLVLGGVWRVSQSGVRRVAALEAGLSGTWDVCGAVGSGQHLRSTQQIGVSPL